MPNLYELTVTAIGEVRDADGNLISSTPINQTVVLNENELNEILEGEQ